MKKLLKPKDILLLTLAGVGDTFEEIKDPLCLVSSAYKNMYGFIPRRYKKNNFLQMVGRNLKTGDIEKVVKNGEAYLRLTSVGRNRVRRDFSISNLTKKWNKKWIVLVFDISEKVKAVRDKLRNKLVNIGFGMLQESVWITPLPIGKDMLEFIESIGLENNVFIMEVSSLPVGDPKLLARRIWCLDKLEDNYSKIKNDIEMINQLLERYRGREHQREAKTSPPKKKTSSHIYRLQTKKRLLTKKLLELFLSLPPLPKELLPKSFRNGLVFRFR